VRPAQSIKKRHGNYAEPKELTGSNRINLAAVELAIVFPENEQGTICPKMNNFVQLNVILSSVNIRFVVYQSGVVGCSRYI
jgi:hypothetical protein